MTTPDPPPEPRYGGSTSDARLAQLEHALASLDPPDVSTIAEFGRFEQVRFARRFELSSPTFRTAVRLRFHGPAVQDHDLDSALAGQVIAHFAEAVKASGARFRDASPASLVLFLSPNVAPGSTVVELFGAARPEGRDPSMTEEIEDTPVDLALAILFDLIEAVDSDNYRHQEALARPIDGSVGRRLFALAKDLINGDLDLDVSWQRPRGRIRSTALSRERARALRDALDMPTTTVESHVASGVLDAISTGGPIGVRLDGRTGATTLTIEESDDRESLRSLWKTRVEVRWTETTIQHPQRDTKTVERVLTAIGPAEDQAQLGGMPQPTPQDD